MTHPDHYGDQGAWPDPQGRHRRSGYPQGPYQQDPYRQGPYQQDWPQQDWPQQDWPQQGRPQQGRPQQDRYQRDLYQRDLYQRDLYQRDLYQQSPPQGAYRAVHDAGPADEAERLGGAEGNERLTVLTGTVLLILLAAEGFTILSIGRLLTLHFFLGMLLLGPVALKAGSVTYRFFRYYTGSAPYRRKGPPAPLLRLLGPIILLLTACVFGSGVMLAIVGPAGRQPWLTAHKATFVLWFGAMAIHVLAYASRLPRRLYAEARGVALPEDGSRQPPANRRPATRAAQVLGGRGVRLSLLIASLLAGLVIALLTVHLANAWEAPGAFFHP